MSILQEYAEIRQKLSEREFALINEFLNTHRDILLSDVYYKQEVWKQYEDWKKERK